jgi:signal transduction histidine kinase
MSEEGRELSQGQTRRVERGRVEDEGTPERRVLRDASHALRSSLTVCRWRLELLGRDPAEQAESVALVTAELERMEALLDDLTLYADAAGPVSLRPEPVDLELLAHELVAEASTIGERDWKLDRAGGTVLGDPGLLREAVLKLARNAVLHTDRKETIAIGAGVGGGEARLWVRDTGCALSTGAGTQAANGFAREACRHRDHRDVGIANALVGAIVEAHRGSVELETCVVRGTIVTIVLPA